MVFLQDLLKRSRLRLSAQVSFPLLFFSQWSWKRTDFFNLRQNNAEISLLLLCRFVLIYTVYVIMVWILVPNVRQVTAILGSLSLHTDHMCFDLIM